MLTQGLYLYCPKIQDDYSVSILTQGMFSIQFIDV